MPWYVAALFAAVCDSVRDLLCKHSLKDYSAAYVAWAITVISIPPLILAVAWSGVPEIANDFWIILGGVAFLDTIGTLLFFEALRRTDLSLCLPMLMFTPLFLLITSPIMIGEYPGLIGIGGVFLIVCGSYVLNISTLPDGWVSPFRALFRERGAQLMFFAALIFSVCCNLHKTALLASSPVFYALTHQVAVGLLFTPFALRAGSVRTCFSRPPAALLVTGGVIAAMILFQMHAFSTGFVVYALAIKRCNVLISICLAYLFFREGSIRERLVGAGMMVAGAALTSL